MILLCSKCSEEYDTKDRRGKDLIPKGICPNCLEGILGEIEPDDEIEESYIIN